MIVWLIGGGLYLAASVVVGLIVGKTIRHGTDSEREVSGE
jgi:hypothetical protein